MTFGTAAIGIRAAGAFNVRDDRFVSTIVFLVAIPFLSAVVLMMWFAQVIGCCESVSTSSRPLAEAHEKRCNSSIADDRNLRLAEFNLR